MQLRAKTLNDIKTRLEESYFTADSFRFTNTPNTYYFLEIEFSPAPKFCFKMFEADGTRIGIEESPGELIATNETRYYSDLVKAIAAISPWIRRIREEYSHAASIRTEVDEFLEKFRAKVFVTEEDEDPLAEFSQSEINDLKDSLDKLKAIITEQAEQISSTSSQVNEFQREIERIKEDLSGMPRGVWKKVASNKILKSIKNFAGTPEGRKLIADGLKEMIGMD